MNAKLLLLIAALSMSGCQNAMSPAEVRTGLELREKRWRAALASNYDLSALSAFVEQATSDHGHVGSLELSTKTLGKGWVGGGASMRSFTRERFDGLHAAQACGVGVDGAQVIELEIGIVGEHLRGGHAAAEQFEEKLDRVAQAAAPGLTVAHAWIEGDAGKQVAGGHGVSILA
jgi:hypothetical protein